MLVYLFHALLIASLSWCYHTILKDYLLSWWFRFGYEYFGQYQGTWKEHFYMPIWGCQYCTSGQLALWLYFYLFWCDYEFYYHIMFISLTILFTKIIFDAKDLIN